MSRRGGWIPSFRSSESLRQEEAAAGDRACSRGDQCSGATVTRLPDGTRLIVPAPTPRAFCEPCRARISSCLMELPSAWSRLAAALGDPPKLGKAIRVPPGPRIPLRPDVDALMREMALILGSWWERVADIARLSPPDVERLRRDGYRLVTGATAVLSAHLEALLALPEGPVSRVLAPAAAKDRMPGEDGTVRPDGMAHMLPGLSGKDAGMEILDLHYRARKILGETRAPAETFDGVPCRGCESMTLERAEPPSDPSRPAMHSWCPRCGDAMDDATFAAWARTYAFVGGRGGGPGVQAVRGGPGIRNARGTGAGASSPGTARSPPRPEHRPGPVRVAAERPQHPGHPPGRVRGRRGGRGERGPVPGLPGAQCRRLALQPGAVGWQRRPVRAEPERHPVPQPPGRVPHPVAVVVPGPVRAPLDRAEHVAGRPSGGQEDPQQVPQAAGPSRRSTGFSRRDPQAASAAARAVPAAPARPVLTAAGARRARGRG